MYTQVDMVNDVPKTVAVDSMDDSLLRWLDSIAAPSHSPLDASQPGPATWAAPVDSRNIAQATPSPFQFGCPGESNVGFVTPAPAQPTPWWYQEDSIAGWDGMASGNGGPTPSGSSSSMPPDSMANVWYGQTPLVCDTTSTGMDSGMVMDGSSWTEQFMATGLETTPGFSGGDNTIFEPNVASQASVSSQSQSVRPFLQVMIVLSIGLLTFLAVMANQTLAGWTYRQILETVAFPPRYAPHLWKAKVSQLAADLRMPKGSIGQDIVTFVDRAATVKNELDQVAPLVRTLAGAARLVEGRDVVPEDLRPLVRIFYPGVARLLGFLDPAGRDLDTAPLQDYCGDISLASTEEHETQDYPTSRDEADEEAAENVSVRQRHKVTEEDRYCRVGSCLKSFKDPYVCAKHRMRHFTQNWHCPGPCRARTVKGGMFARKETLKRHLSSHPGCKEVVLRALGLEAIPTSGTAWLAPFRVGPECPWKRPGYRLTDLEAVKERLRDPNFTAPPAEHIRGRQRHK